jgi:hypothetical protein
VEGAYGELFEAVEFGTLHDGVQHGLDDEARVGELVVGRDVHADEGLQEADQEGEEDERLAHHDFEHNQHGAEEAVCVQVQQQSHVEHGRRRGQEIVAELVELVAEGLVAAMTVRYEAEDKRDGEQGIEGQIEDVPEADVVAADLNVGDDVSICLVCISYSRVPTFQNLDASSQRKPRVKTYTKTSTISRSPVGLIVLIAPV